MGNNNKVAFRYNAKEFMELTEEERVRRIHDYPAKYKRILVNRYKLMTDRSFTKSPVYSFAKPTNLSGHSDPTAEAVMDKLELDEELQQYNDVLAQDIAMDESLSDSMKGFLVLRNSMKTYEYIMTLYDDEVTTHILRLRRDGYSNKDISKMMAYSESNVNKRIGAAKALLQDKIDEVLDLSGNKN